MRLLIAAALGIPANRGFTVSVPDAGPGVTYQWSINEGYASFIGSTTGRTATFVTGNYSLTAQVSNLKNELVDLLICSWSQYFLTLEPALNGITRARKMERYIIDPKV